MNQERDKRLSDRVPSKSILKRHFNPLDKLGVIPDKCHRCQTTAYPVDRIQISRGLYYHPRCFQCITCDAKLTIQTFKTFKDKDRIEVYCQRHLPRFPGDMAGEEYLGEAGIREALTLYKLGEPMFSSTLELSGHSGQSRRMKRFMDKRNSYYQHIGRSLSHIPRGTRSEGCRTPTSICSASEFDNMSLFSMDDDHTNDLLAFSEPEYSQSGEEVFVSPESFHQAPVPYTNLDDEFEEVHLKNNDDSDSECQTPVAKMDTEEEHDNPFRQSWNEPVDPEMLKIATDLNSNVNSISAKHSEHEQDDDSKTESETDSDSSSYNSDPALDMIPPPAEFSDISKSLKPPDAFFPTSNEDKHSKKPEDNSPVVVHLKKRNSRRDRLEAARNRFLSSDTPPTSPVIKLPNPIAPAPPPKPVIALNTRPPKPSKPPPPPPATVKPKVDSLDVINDKPENLSTTSPSTQMFKELSTSKDWPDSKSDEERGTNSADKQWRPAHFPRRRYPISGDNITVIRPGGYFNNNRPAENHTSINGTFTNETDSDSEGASGNAHKATPFSPIDSSESSDSVNSSSSEEDNGNEFMCETRLSHITSASDAVDNSKEPILDLDSGMKVLSISSIGQLEQFSNKHQDHAITRNLPRSQPKSFPAKACSKPKKKRLGSPPTRSKNKRGLPVIFERSSSLERAAAMSDSDEPITPPALTNIGNPNVLIDKNSLSTQPNMAVPIQDKCVAVDPPAQCTVTSVEITTEQPLSTTQVTHTSNYVGPPTQSKICKVPTDKTKPEQDITINQISQYDTPVSEESTDDSVPMRNIRQVNVPLFEGFTNPLDTQRLSESKIPRFPSRQLDTSEIKTTYTKKSNAQSTTTKSTTPYEQSQLLHRNPKHEVTRYSNPSIQIPSNDSSDFFTKSERPESFQETDIDSLPASEITGTTDMHSSRHGEFPVKHDNDNVEISGSPGVRNAIAHMEQLTRPPVAPKPKPKPKPKFDSSDSAAYVKLPGFDHKSLKQPPNEAFTSDEPLTNSPKVTQKSFNPSIRVKLPGFERPQNEQENTSGPVKETKTSTNPTSGSNQPKHFQQRPQGALKEKVPINSDSDSSSYSSTSSYTTSESESDEEVPPPVKHQSKPQPAPIIHQPVLKPTPPPAETSTTSKSTSSPSSVPKHFKQNPSAAFSWKKKSKDTPHSTSVTVEKDVTMKNPTLSSSGTTPITMTKPQDTVSPGLGKVMSKSGEVSLIKPTQPKPILKPDPKDASRSTAPNKSVTLSSGIKDTNKPDKQDQNVNKTSGARGAESEHSQPPKSALKQNTETPNRFTVHTEPARPLEPPITSDITAGPIVLQEMVDDILHSRQEDQIETQRDIEVKEKDRQKRREDESKKISEWQNQREQKKNQRSNEISENIVEMDKAIDHVATHITNIDETLDKMKDFNRTMMTSLENLSDGEVSLPDVDHVGTQMAQTDLTSTTKGKPKGKSSGKNNSKGRRSSSSESSDTTNSDSSKEGKHKQSKKSDGAVSKSRSKPFPQANQGGTKPEDQQNKKLIVQAKSSDDTQAPKIMPKPGRLKDMQPHLRHLNEGDRLMSDSSSICEEPERLAMREKLQRFERKIDRVSGKFKHEKPPPELPSRLQLDYVPLDDDQQHEVPGYENTGFGRGTGYENTGPESGFGPSDSSHRPPVPVPRKAGSGDTLDKKSVDEVKYGRASPQSYEDMAAAIMENRRKKAGRNGKEKNEESDSSLFDAENQASSKAGKSPLYERGKKGRMPSETESIPEDSTFKKSSSLTPQSRKTHSKNKQKLGSFDESAEDAEKQSSDDSSDDSLTFNGDQKNRYVRGGTARGRPFQRGGTALRASARTKSVENMLGQEKPNHQRRASQGDGAFISDSESDQELQSLYDSIAGRQGTSASLGGHGQHSRSKSFDHLADMDHQPRAPTLPGASSFQRAYRGGVEQRLRASLASSMRSMTDIRGKGSAELAQLLQSYLDAGRDEKIRSMLRMVMRDDAGKVDELLSRFNDEFRTILEGKIQEAGLSAEDADSVFNMAFSMSDLHNGLMPGINSLEAGAGFPGNDPRYQSGLADLGLGSGSTIRVIYQRPGEEEGPTPPMKPKPKPIPPTLPKSTLLQDWTPIDENAIEVSNLDITTFTQLAFELTKDCKSDIEKVRALFRWITVMDYSHMDFDPSAAPESLLGMMRGVKHRQLSNNEIFHKLCRFAAIHCEYVPGYSKGAGYRPGMNLKDNRMFRNIWTAVFVGGAWRFVNCNWGARYLSTVADARQATPMAGTLSSAGNLNYHLADAEVRCRCDEFYFLTDPQEHIFEHFPDDKRWQLLRKSISLEQFMRLPILKSPFFNAKMALKKKYAETLLTKSGSINLKIQMPQFVAVSCTLENRADMSLIHGMTLIRVIDDAVVITASPSQPGKYYLNVYISENWREEDCRELACSFQVHCSETNYDRLVHGRFPDIGFLGRTPAAQKFGVAFNERTDPYMIWNDAKELKIPVTLAPGLKVCHQMKSFDRPGKLSAVCDYYAALQTTDQQAFYTLRFPLEAFYYLMVFATKDDGELPDGTDSDQLECVYRFLIDVRKGQDRILPYPRQTPRWNGCFLRRPDVQHLKLNRKYEFRLKAPGYVAISVVINGKTWIDLVQKSGTWSKKVHVGDELGELSIYGMTSSDEEETFVKLLDYSLIQNM